MGISSSLGSSALLPAGLGFRNVVINGGFDVWQRGTSVAMGSTQSSSFLADRWSAYRSGGGATQSRRDASLDGFQYCYRMQRDSGNTGVGKLYAGTSFETSTVMKLQNKFVVFSFYARKGSNYSSTSDIFTTRLYTGTGAECNGLYVGFTNLSTVIEQNSTLTTTWQRFTYSGLMPATVTQTFLEFSYTPTGTAGANDYVEITGVQLEQNYQATPFEQRPYGVELALCQRYYWRSYSSNVYTPYGVGATWSTSNAQCIVVHPTTMRTTVSSIDSSSVGIGQVGLSEFTATLSIAGNATNSDVTSIAVSGTGYPGAGTFVQLIAKNSASSYLGFSAEL